MSVFKEASLHPEAALKTTHIYVSPQVQSHTVHVIELGLPKREKSI